MPDTETAAATFTIPDETTPGPVTIADAPAADPEAPYGRLRNGRARKTPPKRGPRASAGPKASSGPAAPKATTPRKPKPSATPDFRPVLRETVGVASALLMGLGRVNRAFLADAAAVQLHAEPVVEAVNEVAKINEGVARLLSMSAPAVPYVMLGGALFQMGAQIAANHGVRIPLPGAVGGQVQDPSVLADAMEQQMMAAAAAAQAQASPEHARAA